MTRSDKFCTYRFFVAVNFEKRQMVTIFVYMSQRYTHTKEEIAELLNLAESAIAILLDDLKPKVGVALKSSTDIKVNKSKEKDLVTESIEEQLRKSRERIMRLKEMSIKLQAGNISDFRDISAYQMKAGPQPQGVSNSYSQLLANTVQQFNFVTEFDSVRLARKGFPKSVLLSLAKKISLNIQELANILHISERTLQRYDDNAIIKTEYAEKAVELARLYTRGEEVFGSMDKFKIWVKTPGYVFKGEAPVTILDTSAGFDMVFRELGRIEHGIFA